MHIRKIFIITTIVSLISSMVLAEYPASQNYSLKQPKIVISIGRTTSGSYTLENVIVGNIFGGKAESANYSLCTYFLPGASIYICPLDWTLDAINPGESSITGVTDRIIVKNAGSVKASYGLCVIDVSGTWDPSDTLDGNNLNKFIISGIFTDKDITDVNEASFNEVGSEDLILCDSRLSSDTEFATALSDKNGINVSPGEERALWLKFTAPRIDTTQDSQHNLWLILEAKEVN